MKKTILIIAVIILLAILFFNTKLFFTPTETSLKQEETKASYGVIVDSLNIPWEIEFLPDNEFLITERSGNLIKIGKNKEIIPIQGVKHIGEGGLLGLILHPDFKDNNYIYLYFTSEINNKVENRVERYKLVNSKLENKKTILEGIPGARFHDGGRIKFSPDKKLHITTGDAGNSENSQNVNSLAGKILRLNDDGSIPEDNPFNNPVYSYGHRNPQGITWDDKGNLWSTEHGRSGIQSGLDELNLIEKGKNYGWPVIQGDETKENMQSPIIHSGPDETWAPASALFYNGKIFFTGLRGESLYEYNIKSKKLTSHLRKEFGRLRTIRVNNNEFYVLTSNTDGRGNPRENDDRIIKIDAQEFS